jgi:uncharacterized protein (TIGR03435 family)
MTRIFVSLTAATALFGQAPDPRFEVASIKLTTANSSSSTGLRTGNGRLTVGNETLKRCIMGAFAVGPNQIVGGPEWIAIDRFDISARAEEPVNSDAVIMAMLRTLLAERFKLVAHRETREMRAYVLEVAKNGPKLQKADPGSASTQNGRGMIEAKVITMTRFAEVLSRQLDFPVVNETGIDGIFNLTLQWTPESAKPSNGDGGPSIFTAIQEQLGLRLTSRKAPVEVVVIDHVEKPSEN